MRLTSRRCTPFVFVGIALLSLSVSKADESESGWTRAPQPPFQAPAGALCRFAIGGESLIDHVVFRTLQTFPDGSPKEQFFKGALVVRFTNLDTGAFVDRNLSAAAHVSFGSDGSQDWSVDGPAGFAFFPGDNVPAGMYVVRGSYDLYYAPGFAYRQLTPADAPKENLCDTLK
jgi:hypothetical protein